MKKILFCITVINVISLSYAQETKNKNIDEVVILGRKKLKQERAEFKRHAQSTETLSEDELNRNNSAMIEQSLSTMSGVQVDKRTNFGGQRIVVRGYGNDQKFNNWGVKMYLNGVPLTNADGVTVLEDLDFALVTNVEVIKGPAATMYGGGVGGAVRFYIRPTEVNGTTASEKITLGSFNHFQSQSKFEAKTDKASLLFNYNHLQSNGYRPTGNTLKNNYSFFGNYKISDKQSFSVFAAHNNSYEGVSGQISYADYYAGKDPGNTAYMRKGAGNKFISNRVYITHKYNFSSVFSNNTSVFYGSLDTKRIAAGAFETSQNPNYGARSVFTYKKNISDSFTNDIDFGTEYLISRAQISNYRFTGSITDPLEVQPIEKGSYFNYNNNHLSIFAIDRFTYTPFNLSLIVGISGNKMGYEREDLLALKGLVPNYGKNLSFSKDFKMVFSPHIALQKTWKSQIFNISYSEGYNAPTAATAAISGINTNVVNDNLKPERAEMWDFSVQGLLAKTRFDYQLSFFNISITDKLTALKQGTTSFWTNTGKQVNKGFEASLGYVFNTEKLFRSIKPFINYSYYDFKYNNLWVNNVNYANKKVVGVPKIKYAIGLDFDTNFGVYLINTFNYLGDVYTDFANSNRVKGFGLLNAKIGYKKTFGKWDLDAFLAGNNLTNQINYTFLFLGNNINDSDVNSNYPGIATDLNPGPNKAYFFYGLNLKYRF